jgi:hypothetical protein
MDVIFGAPVPPKAEGPDTVLAVWPLIAPSKQQTVSDKQYAYREVWYN